MEYEFWSYITWWNIFIGIFVLYFTYDAWRHTLFWRCGIKGPFPKPVFGNMFDVSKGLQNTYTKWIKKYGRIVGAYERQAPYMLIAEPDILEKILLKDFKKFSNRRVYELKSCPFDKSVGQLTDPIEWYQTRHMMTSVFSNDSLRRMFENMNDNCSTLVRNIKKSDNNQPIQLKRTHPTYHELLLASLWGCVVHTSASVRVFCAKLFEVLVKGMNEGLVSSRVTPALITLSGDQDLAVKLATIPAFGTIMENTAQKETLDRVYIQFQSFLDDPAYRDEHTLLVQLIHTFGKVGPNAEPKFRDEFVLPRLAAIAHANNNTSVDARKSDVATALFEAYSALSCCFVSDDLIRDAMLPGLRCLRQDMEQHMPEHEAIVSSMIKEMEGKLIEKERSGSTGSSQSFAHLSEDARKTLFNKIGAQRTKMATVFHAKKK